MTNKKRRKRETMTIFVNGKQKRIPRPPAAPTIAGIPASDFVAQNADPIWLLQNGYYELLDGHYANAGDGMADDDIIPF